MLYPGRLHKTRFALGPLPRVVLMISALCAGTPVAAAEVQIAVAANFAAPMRALIERFEADTGHEVKASYGSTGKLYAQIKNGAPFQALLSADQARPLLLEQEGAAVTGSRFTYAIGKLVLWSADPNLVQDGAAVLRAGGFDKLALANPKLAPYGQAAMETLEALGVAGEVAPKLVRGENVSQTYQFIDTGNVPLGFIALSQVAEGGEIAKGSGWIVPSDMHAPVRQDAVTLKLGEDNPALAELMDYLRGDAGRAMIRGFGYDTD